MSDPARGGTRMMADSPPPTQHDNAEDQSDQEYRPRLPRASITYFLVYFLAPKERTIILDLLQRSARRARIGLNDRTAYLCCGIALMTVINIRLLPLILSLLAGLYLALLLLGSRFRGAMMRNEWAIDLLLTPIPSSLYARAFMRFFLMSTAFVFLPYMVFIYLAFLMGFQQQELSTFYMSDVLPGVIKYHLLLLSLCWMFYWCTIAGRSFVLLIPCIPLATIGLIAMATYGNAQYMYYYPTQGEWFVRLAFVVLLPSTPRAYYRSYLDYDQLRASIATTLIVAQLVAGAIAYAYVRVRYVSDTRDRLFR